MLAVDISNLVRSVGVVMVKTSRSLVGPMPSGLPDTLCDSPRKYSCEECTNQWPQSGSLITGRKADISPVQVVDVHVSQSVNFQASSQSFVPLVQEF